MNRKRNLGIFIGVVILAAALVSGFVLMQPSAQDMLVQAITATRDVTDGHAVVAFDLDSLEQNASGVAEIWMIRGEDSGEHQHNTGAFRVEVLEASKEKAQGAVIVSDGETLWAYSPMENKVFVGTPEEAQAVMAENEAITGEFGQFHERHEGEESHHEEGEGHEDGDHDEMNHEHPETAEQAVAKLLEYFNLSKSGSEPLAGETTSQLKLEPIPEQMPDEYIAVGGYLNLWVSQDSNLPLSVSYTGGSMGEFNATVLEYEVNAGVDQALFTFEIPEGAEVVTFADLEPKSLTLEEAGASAEFALLTPAETPPGATLVDILEVRAAIVQRYTLPEGGSFTIAQGVFSDDSEKARTPSDEGQSVELRGTTATLLASEDGTQVLLTWTEGDLFYSVAGDLTPEQATSIAESLK